MLKKNFWNTSDKINLDDYSLDDLEFKKEIDYKRIEN